MSLNMFFCTMFPNPDESMDHCFSFCQSEQKSEQNESYFLFYVGFLLSLFSSLNDTWMQQSISQIFISRKAWPPPTGHRTPDLAPQGPRAVTNSWAEQMRLLQAERVCCSCKQWTAVDGLGETSRLSELTPVSGRDLGSNLFHLALVSLNCTAGLQLKLVRTCWNRMLCISAVYRERV